MSTWNRRQFQVALALSLALILALGLAGSAAAVEIRGGDTVTIGQDEVIDDDLILGGENVVMDGTVNGDLIVGGANVVINGTVNGSLVMGGQSVTLNGRVAGSVYSSGASITFGPNASVGRNTFVAGYSFEMESGSAVARDALVAGYQGILAGEVGRDLRADVGALELNGVVGGDVQANVGEPEPGAPQFMPFFMPGMPTPIEPGLRVGPEAEIGGQLIYTSAIEQSSNIATQPGGGVVFQTPQPGEQPQAGPSPQVSVGINILNWFVARGRELITLLIFGALVLWQAPAQLNTVIEKARTQTLPAAGWGLVVIIVGYAGAFIVAGLIVALGILFGIVTLGGLSGTVLGVGLSGLGLVFTVFTFLVSYGSKLVVAYLVSKLLMQRLAPQYAENKVGLLALGVVLYVIIRGIPLFGWLIGVIVTLVGVGAMWLAFREWRARPMVSAMLAPAT